MMSPCWLLGLDGRRRRSPFASSSLYPPRRMTISMFQVLYFPMLLGPRFCPSFSFTISSCRVSWPCGATLGVSNLTPVHKMHPERQLASLSRHSISQSGLKAREQHGAPSWQHNSHRYCLLTTVTGKHRETPPSPSVHT